MSPQTRSDRGNSHGPATTKRRRSFEITTITNCSATILMEGVNKESGIVRIDVAMALAAW